MSWQHFIKQNFDLELLYEHHNSVYSQYPFSRLRILSHLFKNKLAKLVTLQVDYVQYIHSQYQYYKNRCNELQQENDQLKMFIEIFTVMYTEDNVH
jgi:hypothetical protein